MNLSIPTFKSMQRKMGITTTLFVLVGVMVSFFYLSVIDPLPTSGDALHQIDWFGFGATILIVVILYIAGAARGKRLDSRISAWYEPLRLGEQRASIPIRVKRDVLNYPIINATNSALMWTVAGVLFALLTGSFRVFVGLALIAGLLTSVMLYFASDLVWRPAIPLFFPHGSVSSTHAFRLPVLGKLLTVFLLIGIVPPAILANLSWQRAQILLTSPDPQTLLDNLLFLQLFILITGILSSIGLAVFMTRTITGPLHSLEEAMKRIERNEIEVRVPVLSNDELGYMGERLNEMAAGLEEQEKLREMHQKMEQELAVAWGIQSSFLPKEKPILPGWQLTAKLEPAKQTSGDFFDFIPLPGDRLGFLIADVADKGTGAALYMAMSRTLLRTYAYEYADRPAEVLHIANRRILIDTQSDLFVTVFYAVLELLNGKLTYCNAGHNPPYLFQSGNGREAKALTNTGIPLGMFDDMHWRQRVEQIDPGDLLLLYTDGVTEAQGDDGSLFGEQRLLNSVRSHRGCAMQEMQTAVLSEVREFMGGALQFDDITLMLLGREHSTM